MYKDLIFNSRGCFKSNQLLRHPRFCLETLTSCHRETMFCARTKITFNAPKDGRGKGQSSTDVHGTYIG